MFTALVSGMLAGLQKTIELVNRKRMARARSASGYEQQQKQCSEHFHIRRLCARLERPPDSATAWSTPS
eukprot:SAG22_NODE_130_length_18670_cov_12.091379_21_plen_69_part_00